MKKWSLFYTFLLAPITLFSLETNPWIGALFEIETHFSLFYQNFDRVASSSSSFRYSSNDFFPMIGAGVAIAEDFAFDIEFTGASTRRQAADLDNIAFGMRYVMLDDVAGDPMTVTLGLNIIKAFDSALKDIASFHHGKFEGEWTLAFGKEVAHGELWCSRFWTLVAFGLGDHGSPWYRANAAWENRFVERHIGRFFVNTLWGSGKSVLKSRRHFHGYGPIHHQSVDVGFRYTYENEYFGNVALEYFFRPFARSFPSHVNGIVASVEMALAL